MAIRNILTEDDKQLFKKSRPVIDFNNRISVLIDDMRETLLATDGVGLAAPQVGILRRVCLVMDTSKEELSPSEQIIELINPEIIATEGEQEGLEGCLSVPGIYGTVKRPEKVTVRAFDRNGDVFEVNAEGFTARCFCHEIDHLDGHIFKELASELFTSEELQNAENNTAEEAE